MLRNEASVFLRDEDIIQLHDLTFDLPTERKFKDSGAMIAPATIARTGIMNYRAGTCGALFADRDPESIVRIMTEASELFDADSIESYRAAPITIGHPLDDVSIENAKELMKGQLESVPFADGENLSGVIVLNEVEAINLVEAGVSQLSSGHNCVLVLADAGEDFDAKKTKIRANHIAIVRRGRAGNAQIADEALDVKTPTAEELAEKHGVPIADVEAVIAKGTKVELEHTTDTTKAAEIARDHIAESMEYYGALAEMEEELAAKDEAPEVKIFDQDFVDALDAKMDALATKLALRDEEIAKFNDTLATSVKERIAFLSELAQFSDADFSEMSEHDAKVVALKDALGLDLKDKSKSYIDIRYDIMKDEGIKDEGLSQAFKDTIDFVTTPVEEKSPAQTSRDKMIARNSAK